MLKRLAIATIALLALLYTGCGKPQEIKAEFVAAIGRKIPLKGSMAAYPGGKRPGDGYYQNLTNPWDRQLLVDEQGNVYVADELRVQKFDSKGMFLGEFRPESRYSDLNANEMYDARLAQWGRVGDHDIDWKPDWEMTREETEQYYGDWWDLATIQWFDDEHILVSRDESHGTHQPRYYVLDRELKLVREFETSFPRGSGFRRLRVDPTTGWMVATWTKFMNDKGPMGMGPMTQWIAPVDENGKQGREEMFRSDCHLWKLYPDRRMLCIYRGEFNDPDEYMNTDWNKLFEEPPSDEPVDYQTEWAILDENQDRVQPVRKTSQNVFKIDAVTPSFSCYFNSGWGNGDKDYDVGILDDRLREAARIVFPEEFRKGFKMQVAFGGEYMALYMDKPNRGGNRGVYLFRVDWPEDLRPAPPTPEQEEANEE